MKFQGPDAADKEILQSLTELFDAACRADKALVKAMAVANSSEEERHSRRLTALRIITDNDVRGWDEIELIDILVSVKLAFPYREVTCGEKIRNALEENNSRKLRFEIPKLNKCLVSRRDPRRFRYWGYSDNPRVSFEAPRLLSNDRGYGRYAFNRAIGAGISRDASELIGCVASEVTKMLGLSGLSLTRSHYDEDNTADAAEICLIDFGLSGDDLIEYKNLIIDTIKDNLPRIELRSLEAFISSRGIFE